MKPLFFYTILTSLLLTVGCDSDDEPGETTELTKPFNISVYDVGNESNSSDIRIFFDLGSSFELVQEYRILVSKEGSTALDIATIASIASDRFLSGSPTSSSIKLNLTTGVLDVDGDPIENEVSYTLQIALIPTDESVEPTVSDPSGSITLTDKELRDIYVSSNATNSVELFDGVTGEHIKSFIRSGTAGLSNTQEVIFLADGNLLVTGFGNTALKLFDGETGSFIRDYTSGYSLDKPTKTSIGSDGFIYVSQWGDTQNSIVRFDLETGVFVDEIIDSWSQGMDHTWDAEGNFYTVSWGLKQLRKYNSEFELVFTVSTQLTGPVNVWTEGNQVFVVDWEDGTVKKFDTDGNFLEVFISGLVKVEGYLFDGDELYLCDWHADEIKVYDKNSGDFLRRFTSSSRIQEANGITFGPDLRP